jgi:hypothetical protein
MHAVRGTPSCMQCTYALAMVYLADQSAELLAHHHCDPSALTAPCRHQFPAMLEARLRDSHRRKRTRDDEAPAAPREQQRLDRTTSTTGPSQHSGTRRLAHAPQSSPTGAAARLNAGNSDGGSRRRSSEERPSKRRSQESVDTPETPHVAATGAVAELCARFESSLAQAAGLSAAASGQSGEVVEAAGRVSGSRTAKAAAVRAQIHAGLAQAAGPVVSAYSLGEEVAEVARQKAAARVS